MASGTEAVGRRQLVIIYFEPLDLEDCLRFERRHFKIIKIKIIGLVLSVFSFK